jgi:GNAT superfamily N-acetyltransferase
VIRRAVTDGDLAAYVSVWGEIRPNDPVSVDFVRERLARETERLCLLAELDGAAVGCGFVGRSSQPGCRPVGAVVLPRCRRRGLGGALLDRCLAHARNLHAETAQGAVLEDDAESLAFVLHRGFVVLDRVVALELDLAQAAPERSPPEGIEIVELDDARLAGAFEVFAEGAGDIPAAGHDHVSPLDEWCSSSARIR